MKKLYFLGGLPRSGSTLLGSLISQHPDVYVSPTSPMGDLVVSMESSIEIAYSQYTFDRKIISYNVYSSLINNYYNHIDKPIILDKHRFWSKNLNIVDEFINNEAKVVATYRPIPDVITSYISLINRSNHVDNFIDNALRDNGYEITNNNRADHIWRYHVSPSYGSIVYGINAYPEKIHLVDYDKLIHNPQEELDKIYRFLDIEPCGNNFEQIYNACSEEKDESWGLKGLHDIRPKLSKISENPIDVIGKENVELYSKFNF